MPSDVEARVIRLEQLVARLPGLVAKEAARSGANAQNVTRLRTADDGGDGVPVSVCGGILLPTTLYYEFFGNLGLTGGVRQPLVWDATAGLWLGVFQVADPSLSLILSSLLCTSFDPSGATWVVMQLDQSLVLSGYCEQCPIGSTTAGAWVAGNTEPTTLTGSSQFGAHTAAVFTSQPLSPSFVSCSPFFVQHSDSLNNPDSGLSVTYRTYTTP